MASFSRVALIRVPVGWPAGLVARCGRQVVHPPDNDRHRSDTPTVPTRWPCGSFLTWLSLRHSCGPSLLSQEATLSGELRTSLPCDARPGGILPAERQVLSGRSSDRSTATTATSCRTQRGNVQRPQGLAQVNQRSKQIDLSTCPPPRIGSLRRSGSRLCAVMAILCRGWGDAFAQHFAHNHRRWPRASPGHAAGEHVAHQR
jgi:hypothetical protein